MERITIDFDCHAMLEYDEQSVLRVTEAFPDRITVTDRLVAETGLHDITQATYITAAGWLVVRTFDGSACYKPTGEREKTGQLFERIV